MMKKLLELLEQLRKQNKKKKEKTREPRRDVAKVLRDLFLQFNTCIQDRFSFLTYFNHNNHRHPMKHQYHYKYRIPKNSKKKSFKSSRQV